MSRSAVADINITVASITVPLPTYTLAARVVAEGNARDGLTIDVEGLTCTGHP